jgi:methionine aminopeptidase
MAQDFKLISNADTVKATIASATVIEVGDLVAMDAGLIIKAVAASTEVAYAVTPSAVGDTEIEITRGRVELLGTGDAVFAVAQKGTEVDIVGTTTQLIDVGASSTDVLKISAGTDAGVVGSTDNIRVLINKPITF